jgi:hypothetical protein
MTPEERCYKILQDSNYISVLEHKSKIQNFLEQIKECPFEFPETDIEKRQFETVLKSWFDQYTAELIEFAKENPSTFKNREAELDFVDFHTMDDQGFNGQVMENGYFYRIINDSIDAEKCRVYKGKSDSDLESMWQAQANMIQMALSKAYNDETDKTESDRCHELAKTAQEKQSLIQDEITRRSKL